MSRLPISGSDDGTWGNILNDYLTQAHNSDGTLKISAITTAGAELTANKGRASGYPSLDASTKVPTIQLGGSGADNTKFLRGDQTWTAPPNAIDATTTSKGVVQLAGDIGGTATSPTVAKINGTTITGTPSSGQILQATSSTSAVWQSAPYINYSIPSSLSGTYVDAQAAAAAATGTLTFGPGTFKFHYPLRFKNAVFCAGASQSQTILQFDAGIQGIIGEFIYDTVNQLYADSGGSFIRDIQITQASKSGTAHGIESRRSLIMYNVISQSVSGDGLAVKSTGFGTQQSGSTTAGSNIVSGNFTLNDLGGFVTLNAAANTWPWPEGTTITSLNDAHHAVLSCPGTSVSTMTNFTYWSSGAFYSSGNTTQASINDDGKVYNFQGFNNGGAGVHIYPGDDTSAWFFCGGEAYTNTGWGVIDESFLGNTWTGFHTATNGNGLSQRTDPSCGLTYLSSTVTDSAIMATDIYRWVHGPGIPAGTVITSVTPGVSFTMSSGATQSGSVSLVLDPPGNMSNGGGHGQYNGAWINMYSEGGSVAILNSPSVVIAGDIGGGNNGTATNIAGTNASIAGPISANSITSAGALSVSAAGSGVVHDGALLVDSSAVYTGSSTPNGTGGSGSWDTSGNTYAVGDRIFNIATANGIDGWICTGTGNYSVATWRPFGGTVVGSSQQASNYIFALADQGTVVESAASSSVNFTIPTHTAVPFPIGTVIEVYQAGVGQITITGQGGVTLREPGGLFHTHQQYSSVALRQRAQDEWVLSGDLA